MSSQKRLRVADHNEHVTTANQLLLVEDDRQLSALLRGLLESEGYRVDVAHDGQAGLHRALTGSHRVLVVDRGLPAIEGVELVARLRRRGVMTPVLILTARGTLADRVAGLDAGAEDYLVKPFEIEELLARLRALLRRHADGADSLSLGVRRLDIGNRQVLRDPGAPGVEGTDNVADHAPVQLSGRECALLAVLAAHPSRTFSRDELLDRAFDPSDTSGVVDTYVHYLRRKLGRQAVRTVHGLGYRLGEA